MAIDQSTLREKAERYTNYQNKVFWESYNFNNTNNTFRSYTINPNKSAFLCHSHKDKELVKGLLVIFEESNLKLYVDWQDHSMPETPDGETAKKIKEKIESSDVFLFLATANSKASRWCPWEIGFADSSKKGIYIIPTFDENEMTYGNEYLELYSHIDSGTYKTSGRPGYFMRKPGKSAGYAISNANIL